MARQKIGDLKRTAMVLELSVAREKAATQQRSELLERREEEVQRLHEELAVLRSKHKVCRARHGHGMGMAWARRGLGMG